MAGVIVKGVDIGNRATYSFEVILRGSQGMLTSDGFIFNARSPREEFEGLLREYGGPGYEEVYAMSLRHATVETQTVLQHGNFPVDQTAITRDGGLVAVWLSPDAARNKFIAISTSPLMQVFRQGDGFDLEAW